MRADKGPAGFGAQAWVPSSHDAGHARAASGPGATPMARRIQDLRLQLRGLSIAAGLGLPLDVLARQLSRAWSDACLGEGRGIPDSRRLAVELVAGCCSLARWLDPARSAEIVPPLGAVLWHSNDRPLSMVGPGPRFDLIVPRDARRPMAMAWASDVCALLALSGIRHWGELVEVPGHPGMAHGDARSNM